MGTLADESYVKLNLAMRLCGRWDADENTGILPDRPRLLFLPKLKNAQRIYFKGSLVRPVAYAVCGLSGSIACVRFMRCVC